MTMNKQLASAAIVGALLCACSGPSVDAPEAANPAAEGADLLKPFKSELMQALSAGMQEGPAAAIEVCSRQAPAIARKLSVDGVRMGRSSHKLRNPNNAPPGWLAPILDGYAAGDTALEPQAVTIDAGRHGYVEPIVTQPMCLTCHGTDIDSEIRAQLDENYPADRATGFEAGDLRGVFWVEF
jgi:hypothetical protein